MDSEGRRIFRESIAQRCWRIGTPDTVAELGHLMRSTIPKGQRMKEGMGQLFLDEAQLLFNSRDWQKNKGFIEFFTQHRKLGWDVTLVAHDISMIDKQIRALIELESRARNLSKCKLFGLIPLSLNPRFLVITRYAGRAAGAGNIYSRRIYALHSSYRHLYDTLEVFAFDAPRQSCTLHPSITTADNPFVSKMPLSKKRLTFVSQAEYIDPYHKIIRPL